VVFRAAGTQGTIPCCRVAAPPERSALRRAETWLITGPVGHLLGGTLDFVNALARYLLARIRGR